MTTRPRGQLPMVSMLPHGTAVLPEDFPERLIRLKEATGLTWNAFARKLGAEPRQVDRWRKGVEPSGGAMLALLRVAALIPGGVDAMLVEPEGRFGRRNGRTF